ncbi:hypothetical protein AC578_6073 [Pseudocercospora eumusae]|uniref:Uncharacterized protein n=1 Tax=Pseudocercospora eumusae TaxID=321146 RepID=A0A139HVR2_9PEZI|nr:hypothetical protein AC578_6073 [Pseudocercospora eumusae]
MAAQLLSGGRCSESGPSFNVQDSHTSNDKLDSAFLTVPHPLQALIEVLLCPLVVLISEERLLPSIIKNGTTVVSWLLAGVKSSQRVALSVPAKAEVVQLNRMAVRHPEWWLTDPDQSIQSLAFPHWASAFE